ncbi:hypothetical protein VOLCADRAFT_107332 [Volvox carteri f. nagariensis]|uniref:tRNA-splicing endonuclease subunit Sen15 domain-containing protein n=1 Tax=Volvox carteri f. nagariensis TaxID=3068 RepID=D8UDC7_VOLCA|nr:uncharacterized protein VOLCADRAFT_107332 [Volvox carteri f. nagariensis]EFJ42286.1 hypothetical protein VOLCADRAFT_107332 [Volvox carteri f. nagariensis]|eukprot:XP_002956684.1 hypothetical protein VOLCADRAFT_107332 [Volvox carteri f. nagariensis]
MFRRWQKEATGKYRTLESFNTFLNRLSTNKFEEALNVCDAADLYSVLSVLHSKSRDPQLQANQSPGFYYFLANAEHPEEADDSRAVADGAAARDLRTVACGRVRREAVVPISSKSTKLTMGLLSKLFQLDAHPNASHILLGIVDDDGSVSLVRVFNYLQPPFEGPEALPPLEPEEGGVGGESDDD